MGESKCYNLTEADKANINGFLTSVGIKKREQWLRSEMYEIKFAKIYFKEENYKKSLKKFFLPIFEVLRQTFQWCLVDAEASQSIFFLLNQSLHYEINIYLS